MNAHLPEGLRCLEERDWVEAIRNLTWAHDIDPKNVPIYLTLIDAFERCAEAEREPDVLQQAFNVCRDLRDRNLPMSPAQQRRFYEAFVRVRDKIISARRTGWTPPPAKEQVRSLFEKPDRSR
jgi:hypothetical protein